VDPFFFGENCGDPGNDGAMKFLNALKRLLDIKIIQIRF
jgi:hypothetical protein